MPVVLGMFALFAVFVGLIVGFDKYESADGQRTARRVALAGAAVLGWVVWSAMSPTDFTPTTETPCFMHDGAAVAIYDGELYNLNDRLARNVEEGTPVYFRKNKAGWYRGMYWNFVEADISLKPFDE